MRVSRWMAAWVLVAAVSAAMGEEVEGGPTGQAATSKLAAVTVYQSTALVTRSVQVPAGTGVVELVVSPLPPSVVPSSVYAEADGAMQVLSTRFLTRAAERATTEEVRKIEDELKQLHLQMGKLDEAGRTVAANLQFVGKLENFTSATMTQMTDKGQLNQDAVLGVAKFVMENRGRLEADALETRQKTDVLREQIAFFERNLRKVAGSADRTVRDAVIVVDRGTGQEGQAAAGGALRLNYVVSSARWQPKYRLRAASDKPDVTLEYQGAIVQQTGEDWTEVDLTLSTAQAQLDSAPPVLSALQAALGRGVGPAASPMVTYGVKAERKALAANAGDNETLKDALKQQAAQQSIGNNWNDANTFLNGAAVVAQAEEIAVLDRERVLRNKSVALPSRSGQAITFHMPGRISVPWRNDEQTIQMLKSNLTARVYHKAVPVLTELVYRVGQIINTGQVVLPGEATVYVDGGFVGRTSLPLVAVGQEFTVGLGVDPQVQVLRTLVDKESTTSWGKAVTKFSYRFTIANYRPNAVDLQLWDRIPENLEDKLQAKVTETSWPLSKNPAYLRDEAPHNLLRWDLKLTPNTSGEKALFVTYDYRLEHDKEMRIAEFYNR